MFKSVWKGWSVGVSVVFTPLLILAALLAPEPPPGIWYAIPLVPAIACLQGIMVGGLVCLGLKIWPAKAKHNHE